MESLKVLKDEKLVENAEKQGNKFRGAMEDARSRHPWIIDSRGKGLLNAIGKWEKERGRGRGRVGERGMMGKNLIFSLLFLFRACS